MPSVLAYSKVPLNLTVRRANGAPVTGLAPTVAIRDALDATLWLDMVDGVFKASGWGARTAVLDEVSAALSPGQYLTVLDLADVVAPSTGFSFVAEYAVTFSGVTCVSSETYTVDDTLVVQRAVLLGESRAAPGDPGSLVIKRPGDTAAFITYAISDFTGAAVYSTPGIPARRSEGVITP
jgi:hypothetical protein